MSLGPGSTIGPFKIQSLIGKGGMGEVFSALDTRLDRKVALKILPSDFATDSDRLRRFQSEAKTLASINHPNILVIHEVGRENSNPYLVSELLEGRTLREELAAGALSVRKASGYALQVAQGLAAAHARSIIHRDLKPENIFITKDARVKILDFGLAKSANLKSEISNLQSSAPTLLQSTVPGAILGTPAYMSPEQVRGEPVDHRTDIFSFGCVLSEMLSGNQPFRRFSAVESMNAILKDEPPALEGPSIPPALERVVRRCLEKQPDTRFQSAKDLAFAIENAATAPRPYLNQERGPGRLITLEPQ